MAEQQEVSAHENVPPPGEEIHLPGPSYLPVLMAFAITLMLVGVVYTWVLTGIGLVIFLVVLVRWIRSTREDISELPLEH
ncbi:MAG TPA: hypothetical protein VF752_15550 [Thermoleophilaceae bacterium]